MGSDCISSWSLLIFFTLFNFEQTFIFMEMAGIKHRGFVTPFVFNLSKCTWNHWLSSDDMYSHMWCHSEKCKYVFYKEYVSPYHLTRVWLRIVRSGSILMPLFPHDSVASWNIQTIYITWKFMYEHPSNFCCDEKSGIHQTKLMINMFIILVYVNNYGTNHYLQKLWHAAVVPNYPKTIIESWKCIKI